MTFFFALHLILSSYLDVVDTQTRPSNVVNTRYSASPSNFPWGTSLAVMTPLNLYAKFYFSCYFQLYRTESQKEEEFNCTKQAREVRSIQDSIYV